MCGIFATTRLDLWRNHIDRVLQTLHHRGPDARAFWLDEDVGILLAHTRLAIVGLGRQGAQPHQLPSSVLAYNGEIYNHARISKQLEIPPPACDTETVHEALKRKGTKGLSLLDGMFALAWWDAAAKRLVVARDHWGIKPMYLYRHAGGGVSIASEMSTLALLRPRVDPYGLAHYLAFGYTTSTATVYERITKLSAGTYSSFELDGRAWRVTSGTTPIVAEANDDLSVVIKESVADQLMADVPVGVFLSGGVDSSLIAAAAVRAGGAPHCFTLSFPESPELDESRRAAGNARRLALNHTTVPVTSRSLASRLPALIACTGEPLGDAAALAVDALAQRASQDVKVVLTGEGADELFGGYVRHKVISRLAAARVSALAPALSPIAKLGEEWRGDRPWQRAAVAALKGAGPVGYAALQQGELFVFASSPELVQSLTAQLRTDWELAVQADRGLAALLFDQHRWLPNTYLEKIDRATMRHSLEGRVPMLSNRLTKWASITRPQGKHALVQELHRLLPGVDLPPKKKGLAIDVLGLLNSGLQPHVDRLLSSQQSVVPETFGQAVQAAMRRRASRSPAFAYRVATVGVWDDLVGSA